MFCDNQKKDGLTNLHNTVYVSATINEQKSYTSACLHRIEKVNFEGAFGCAEDEKSCVQCYYWIQVPDEIKNKPKNVRTCGLTKD